MCVTTNFVDPLPFARLSNGMTTYEDEDFMKSKEWLTTYVLYILCSYCFHPRSYFVALLYILRRNAVIAKGPRVPFPRSYLPVAHTLLRMSSASLTCTLIPELFDRMNVIDVMSYNILLLKNRFLAAMVANWSVLLECLPYSMR
jgi:hypothetical protein